MAETLPRQFGRYELQSVVLRDGFGTIYRARDTHYDREVWVRVLDGDLASDARTAEQFQRAARLASALSHPNLRIVHEVGEADGLPFMSFRPAEGITLAERLRTESPIFPLRAAFIVSQITDALEYLNERWMSHGNLQDHSIWLSADDQVMLLDLGMALGTHTPEKDTEALANLAHEMVVGAPFSRTDATMRRPGIPWRRAADRLGAEMWEILMRGVGHEGKPYAGFREFRDDFVRAAETAEPPPRESRRQRIREQRERACALAQQAGAAARLGQWERVSELAGHALRLNPKDEEARQWLRRAVRVLGGEAPETLGPALRKTRRRRYPVGLLLAAAVIIAGIGGGIWALQRPKQAAPPPATMTPTPRPTRTPAPPTVTSAPVVVPTTTVGPTRVPPTATDVPATATPVSTDTVTPAQPTSTATKAPTQTSIPPSPTPTRVPHTAPTLLSPPSETYYQPQDAIVLQWSGVGPLAEDEWYVVRIPHPLGEEVGVTRETEWLVPAYVWLLKPSSGRLYWSVSVRVRTSEEIPGNANLWPAAGAESPARSFVWLAGTRTPTPTPTATP
jgi:hypothetical protein